MSFLYRRPTLGGDKVLEAGVMKLDAGGKGKRAGLRAAAAAARGGGLRDVENFHFAAGGRGTALEVNVSEPAIQFARGDAALACFGDAVNEGVEFLDAVAGERRKKNHRSVAQELQFL